MALHETEHLVVTNDTFASFHMTSKNHNIREQLIANIFDIYLYDTLCWNMLVASLFMTSFVVLQSTYTVPFLQHTVKGEPNLCDLYC